MKKVLLSFLTLFAASFIAASAQTDVFYESFDKCNSTGGNDGQWSGNVASSAISEANFDNAGWTYDKMYQGSMCAKLGSSSAKGTATTPALSFSGDATLTFKAGGWAGDATTVIISITSGTVEPASVTLTDGSFQDFTVQITGAESGSKITFAAENASKDRFFLDEVKVSVAGDVEITPAPTFSPAGGTYYEAQEVTISAVDGADIYYTIDGNEPTTASTKYESPLQVATTTTVKAIAVRNDVESDVVSATYTIESMPTVNSIAEFLALEEGTVVRFNNPVTVTYCYNEGANTYVQDATGALLIYGGYNEGKIPAYNNGDVIPAGFYGEVDNYNGLQLTTTLSNGGFSASSFGAATENNPVEPVEMTISALANSENLNRYVIVKDATFTVGSGRNATMSDATGELAIYNTFQDAVEFPADGTYDIIGILSQHSGNFQLAPISFESGSGEPIDPEPEGYIFYQEDFSTGADQRLTIQDIDLGGLSYVWKFDEEYNCMKASAFVQGNYATESWLVTPEIDLTNAASAELQLTEVINHINGDNVNDRCEILVSSDYDNDVTTADWDKLSLTNRAEGSSWTEFDVDPYDMTSFLGQKINLAFRYTSTTEAASTWELMSIKVIGEEKSASVDNMAADDAAQAIGLDGEIVIAGEASNVEIYNLAGALIAKGNATRYNCTAGVYIVKIDGQNAQKVIVK